MMARRVRTLVAINLRGWSLVRGVRAGLGCGVPLLMAEGLGQPALSWAALIGFWVALVDPGGPPRTRFLAISFFTTGTAAGCFLAVLVRPHPWLSAGFALIWCFVAILTRVWGDAAGSAGNLLAIAVLIALGLGQPSSMNAAMDIAALTIGGGLLGMVLAFGIGRQQPDAQLAAALGSVFRAEAAFVRDMMGARRVEDCGKPPSHPRRGIVREAIETARAMLVATRRDRLDETAPRQRFVLMLGDADRVLRALLALRELLEGVPPEQVPEAWLSTAAARLDEIAAALLSGGAGSAVARRPAAALRPLDLPAAGGAMGATADVLHQVITWIDAASEHFSSAVNGAEAAGTSVPDHPTGYIDSLYYNLTFESLSLRHAARFAVISACLTLINNELHLDRGYWITLTAVIILQAYPSATWQRAIQRVGGSILGGLIAVGAAFALHGPAEMTLVIIPLSVLAMAFRAVSYMIYILCITPLFILIAELFNNGGVLTPALGGLRIADNFAGAAVGLLATFTLWPSWERRYLRGHLAKDIRCNGNFLLAALDAWTGSLGEEQVDAARRLAGLAGNNAEASLRRALEEPRRYSAQEIGAAMTIMAAARRLAGIGSVIVQITRDAPAGPEFSRLRESLRLHLDEVVSAIEHTRQPAAMQAVAPDASGRSLIGLELGRAWRQLMVLDDAVRILAGDGQGIIAAGTIAVG
jgi:uncharacterized membrane protein YccC